MPELPEVEVVKEGLRKQLKSSGTLQKIDFLRNNLRTKLPKSKTAWVAGEEILNIHRRAKYLLFETEKNIIISHLGMTGSWRQDKNKFKLHDHIVITFRSGIKWIYNDPRRFGIFDIIKKENLKNDRRLKSLGPEPLDTHQFTSDYLLTKIQNKKAPIKSLIMDQKIVVGVGNIYASEALYLAGIRPLTRGDQLSQKQCTRLVKTIVQVLQTAIDQGGSSIRDYVNVDGQSGHFQESHHVYGRSGEPCRKCRGLVRSQVLSGRNTFWCVNCQK